ncbi:uncharacterized protein A4U43_C07F34170 [Asparagus officinalis]|uniref:Uncharacterized protein n=1 Tax=Asparagus officinalis TaxID=4686 RepID=A0A5P1EIX4_ASPOF|nr:uncharacterized protein A4U43_C07F34170 [Asparagus officinalis]
MGQIRSESPSGAADKEELTGWEEEPTDLGEGLGSSKRYYMDLAIKDPVAESYEWITSGSRGLLIVVHKDKELKAPIASVRRHKAQLKQAQEQVRGFKENIVDAHQDMRLAEERLAYLESEVRVEKKGEGGYLQKGRHCSDQGRSAMGQTE